MKILMSIFTNMVYIYSIKFQNNTPSIGYFKNVNWILRMRVIMQLILINRIMLAFNVKHYKNCKECIKWKIRELLWEKDN